MFVKKLTLLVACIAIVSDMMSETIVGRVVDQQGTAVPYASVYLREYPTIGTATDDNGRFSLDMEGHRNATLNISFLGYELVSLRTARYMSDSLLVRLREQPIELEQLVKTHKAPKTRRDKRRLMEQRLRDVAARLDIDMPDKPVEYGVVSDAKVLSDGQLIVFEQVIGKIVEMPNPKNNERDTIQFLGQLAKRYFDNTAEDKYHNANVPQIKKKNQARLNSFVSRVDSGTVVHRILWGGNVKHYFKQFAKHPRRWTVKSENTERSTLQYKEEHNFLGMLKVTLYANYTVDNVTSQLIAIAERADISVRIPFGYKLDSDMLSWLNIVNINQEAIEKFRLKAIDVTVMRNELFTTSDSEPTAVRERNYTADIRMRDNKDQQINMSSNGTVKVVSVRRDGVKPYSAALLSKPIPRQKATR